MARAFEDRNHLDDGHLGRYSKVVVIGGTTASFYATGSNYGQYALITSGSNVSGSAILSGGGTVPLHLLTNGVIYEIGVKELVVPTGSVYALYSHRNNV